MSNSTLATYRRISPHRTSPRNHAIDTISIHCFVGQVTAKRGADYFATTDKEASVNYVIGTAGDVSVSVDEADCSWCSSNLRNDHRAVTIECACDAYAPYAINSKVYATLINLCEDICRRNGIKKLVWSSNKNDRINRRNGCNMTVHRDFANKACPGDYIYERLGQIASEVNDRLAGHGDKHTNGQDIEKGSTVRVKQGAKTYDGGGLAGFVYKRDHVVSEVSGDRCVITYNGVVVAAVRKSDLTLVGGGSANSGGNGAQGFKPYTVKVSVTELRIRSGPGTNNSSKGTIKPGVYTIVEEANGPGAKRWGRLKSGAGWISLDYTERV